MARRVIATLVAGAFLASSLVALPAQPAMANGDPGATSEIDFAADLTGGSGSYFQTASTQIINTDDFTIEAWVKADSIGGGNGWNNIVSQYASSSSRIYLAALNGQIYVAWGGSGALATGYFLPTNRWVHLAVTRSNPGGMNFYVDGVLTGSSATVSVDKPNRVLTVGALEGNVERFDGQIDQVKIWDKALSEPEIAASMHLLGSTDENGSPVASGKSLVALYDFNEGAGDVVHDRVGNQDLNVFTAGAASFKDVKITQTSGVDTVLTFPRSYLPGVGGWTAPNYVTTAKVLVVGGGGGGSRGACGVWWGAGGGGGEAIEQTNRDVTSPSIVRVGQGGSRSVGDCNTATISTAGQLSAFADLEASGGQPSVNSSRAGGNSGSGLLGASFGSGTYGSGGGGGAVTAGSDLNGGSGLSSVIPVTEDVFGAGGPGKSDSAWGNYAGADFSPSSGRHHWDPNTGGGGADWYDGAAGVVVVRYQTPSAPQAVSDFAAETRLIDADSDPDTVNLTWTALGTQVPAATGYLVEWSTDSGFGTVDGSHTISDISASSYLVSGLTDGATYHFRIRGINDLGNGNPATTVSVPISGLDYVLNASGTERASTSVPIIPASTSADFTVEMWLKVSSLARRQIFFYQDPANPFWIAFEAIPNTNYGTLRVRLNGGLEAIANDAPIVTNRWYHIALSVDESNRSTGAKLYIDGTEVLAFSGARLAFDGATEIGFETTQLIGQFDQVKVWSTALTQPQIAASMHAWQDEGISGATLLSHYDFNDFTNTTTLKDQKGSNDFSYVNVQAADLVPLVTPNTVSRPGHVVYRFTRSYLTGTRGWTKPAGVATGEALVIGGGGAGGWGISGGGGAGEVKDISNVSLTQSIVPVIVGAGGFGRNTNGASGQTSSFGSVSAAGGGGGGAGAAPSAPQGGSGGGASLLNLGASVTDELGVRHSGGNGSYGTSAAATGGGGGGAGSVGAPGTNGASGTTQSGGNGGAGISSDITGTSLFYAGGGGGGLNGDPAALSNGNPGAGGIGGGGAGGPKTGTRSGLAAQANTGSGGGGASNGSLGGDGGSGVVILAYPVGYVASVSDPANVSALSTRTATFTTAAAGNGTLQYQWQLDSGSGWSDIAGAISNSYTTPALSVSDSGNQYRVRVTSSVNGTTVQEFSNPATLTVQDIFAATRILEINASDTASFDPASSLSQVNDLSANSFDGTVTVKSGTVQNILRDQSFYFDGADNSYIDIADMNGLDFSSGMTIDFVAKFEAGGANSRVISFNEDPAYTSDWLLVVTNFDGTNPGNLGIEFGNAGTKRIRTFTGAIPVSSDYHRYTIVAYADGSSAQLYVDGVLHGPSTASDAGPERPPASADFTINAVGNEPNSAPREISGYLRQLSVYNTAFASADLPTLAVAYKTVSFDSNGGTDPADMVTSGTLRLPSPGTRAGYDFAGWFEDDDIFLISAGDIGDTFTPGDTQLHAKWNPKTLTITWESAGGSSVSSPATFTTGGTIAKPTDPTKDGKVFVGWSTSGTSAQGDLVNRITSWPYSPSATSDLTLYAIWLDGCVPLETSFIGSGRLDISSETFGLSGAHYSNLEFRNTSPCAWVVPEGVTAIDAILVGGGGSGGYGNRGGGGGAGALLHTSTKIPVSSGETYVIEVGLGAAAAISENANVGASGESTIFGDFVASGGGAGAGGNACNPALAGGSGGGAANSSPCSTTGGTVSQIDYTEFVEYGSPGGDSSANNSGTGGGGGGAGGSGSDGTSLGGTGAGGAGLQVFGYQLAAGAGAWTGAAGGSVAGQVIGGSWSGSKSGLQWTGSGGAPQGEGANGLVVIRFVTPVDIATPSQNLTATYDSAYSLDIGQQVTGGDGTYSFTVTTGQLPPGLSLNATTGLINGTPSQVGSFTVAVTVTDSSGASATTGNFTITVSQANLPNVGAPTVSIPAQTLKTIDVSWTQVANASSYTLKIYGSDGTSLLATLSLDNSISTYQITASNFPAIANGTEYKITLTALGSVNYATSGESAQVSVTTTASYAINWDANGGTLAGGETASFIAGDTIAEPSDPTRDGFDFVGWSTSETNNNGNVADQISSWPLSPGVSSDLDIFAIWLSNLEIATPTTGLTGTFGEVFSLPLSTSGGTGAKSFVASGLPAGLAIDAVTGEISGTPSATGDSIVTVTVSDAANSTSATSFTISIAKKTLATASQPLLSAAPGELKKLNVSWTGVPDASSYTLKIYSAADVELAEITGLTSNTAVITSAEFPGIADDTLYKVSVTAIGTGNYLSGSESTKSSPVRTRDTHTVTWNTHGGSAVSSTTFIGGATISLPASPAKSGKVHAGWSTIAFGDSGLIVNRIDEWPYEPAADQDFTLHAIWLDPCTPSVSTFVGTGTGDITSATFGTAGKTYRQLVFDSLTDCGWAAPSGVTDIDLMVIAGGGSGGFGNRGGGGGAGEVLHTSSGLTISAGEQFLVDVGAGAASSSTPSNNGNSGTKTRFGYFEAIGGGAGGGGTSGEFIASSGGSGGGGARCTTSILGGASTSTDRYQDLVELGNSGGDSIGTCLAVSPGAGGGGAGGAGNDSGLGISSSGAGGAPVKIFGRVVAGGGAAWNSGSNLGGALDGVIVGGSWAGGSKNGVDGTGSGASAQGTGGSGIIVIRFEIPYQTLTLDNEGVTTSQSVEVGTKPIISNVSRLGYTLAGWSIADDETADYAADLSDFEMPNSATTLFAIWTPNFFTVNYTYNGADGGDMRASESYTVGTPGLILPVPTRTGYDFGGWFTDPALASGTRVTDGFTPTETTTLFAAWTGRTYTILFNYNEADSGDSLSGESYTSGLAGISLPSPGRTGYTFLGWFEDSNLTGTAVSAPYVTTQNRTLHAKWQAIQYSVTYKSTIQVGLNPIPASGGTAPTDSNTYIIGQTVPILANTGNLNRLGYSFSGWVTNADGTGTALQSGQSLTMGAANVDLYPKWVANTYQVSYNLAGGTGDLTGAPASWTAGNSGLTLPDLTSHATLAKTGYTFAGWSETQGGQDVGSGYITYEDVTLYAIWTIKTISYSFDKGAASSENIANWPANASANFASTITLPDLSGTTYTTSEATPRTFLFFGWQDDSGAIFKGGDQFVLSDTSPTFTAQWVQLFDVRYAFSGGTHSVAGNGDALCLAKAQSLCVDQDQITLRSAPERRGYTFDGWRVEPASGAEVVKGAGVSHIIDANGYLFYAKWTPVTYTFRFNSSGGSTNHPNQGAQIGQLVTMPDPGFRTGYSFAGWANNVDSSILPIGGTYLVDNQGVNFNASWTADIYNVVFDWQGATGTPEADYPYQFDSGDMPLPAVGDRIKDGFEFAGWSETPGGPLVSGFRPTADDVLYAVWTDGSYNLNFDPKGGTVAQPSAAVPRGSEITLPTPSRDGFVFTGWYDAATGGNKVANGGEIITPSSSSQLFGRWVQRSLFGVDLATLETSQLYTASNVSDINTTLTHNPTGTSAAINIPSGSLPSGTQVNVRFFKDTERQADLIAGDNNYIFSILLSWLNGSGDTATVPNTDPNKPITVTLNNSSIKAGAAIYMVIGDQVTELGRATQDGTVTVELFEDPEIVVAATAPEAPMSVTAEAGDTTASVSWVAPATNGGAEITGYTVTANTGETCTWTSGPLTCEITGLTNNTPYTFTVVATNSVGDSMPSAPSTAVTPAETQYTVTFNSNGGSTIGSGTFTASSSIPEPQQPTRSGFTFLGWTTTLDDENTLVTFPYQPPMTQNLVLFALWEEIPQIITPPVTTTPGPAAGIEAVSGQTRAWTKRISATEVKVYIKFPEMGSNYQIRLQKNNGEYVRLMSKTVNTTASDALLVVGDWYYLVRTIELPGDGRYRIEVTQDGERISLNGKDRPAVYTVIPNML